MFPLRVTRQCVTVLHMDKPPDLIGSTEAARLLQKSPRTIHRLVTAGTLTPAVIAPGGFNGVYLFHRADVVALRPKAAA